MYGTVNKWTKGEDGKCKKIDEPPTDNPIHEDTYKCSIDTFNKPVLDLSKPCKNEHNCEHKLDYCKYKCDANGNIVPSTNSLDNWKIYNVNNKCLPVCSRENTPYKYEYTLNDDVYNNSQKSWYIDINDIENKCSSTKINKSFIPILELSKNIDTNFQCSVNKGIPFLDKNFPCENYNCKKDLKECRYKCDVDGNITPSTIQTDQWGTYNEKSQCIPFCFSKSDDFKYSYVDPNLYGTVNKWTKGEDGKCKPSIN